MGHSQSTIEYDTMLCKLEYIQSIDSFALYYQTINLWEKEIIKSEKFDQLTNTEPFYNYLPKTEIDSFYYRKQLTRHAFHLSKYINQKYKANIYYELAHDYVADKSYLDEWCRYSEKNLAYNYDMQNNYNKAIYYYKKCINCYNKYYPTEISRLYGDLGRSYSWIGDFELMKQYFDLGISSGNEQQDYRVLQSIYADYASYYIDIVNNQDSMFIAKEYILRSEEYLKKIARDDRYYNNEVSIESVWGDYFAQAGLIDVAFGKYSRAILILENNRHGAIDRKLAKIYFKLAKIYFDFGDIPKSMINIDKAYHNLTGSEIEHLPQKFQLSKENTFTDLFYLLAKIYWKESQIKPNTTRYLDSLLMAIDLGIYTNDILDVDIDIEQSNYISSELNKSLVNLGIVGAYKAFEKTGSDNYKNKARKLFDISKGRILQKNRNRLIKISSLKPEDRHQLLVLQDELIQIEDHNTRDKDDIDLDIRFHEIHNNMDSIISFGKMETTELRFLQNPYLDYLLADSTYYLFTNIGDQNFYKLGSQKYIEQKISLVFKAIDNKSTNGIIENCSELFDLLIPANIQDIERIFILPDGILSVFPFDILYNTDDYLVTHTSYVIMYNIYEELSDLPSDSDEIWILNPQYPQLGDMTNSNRGSLGPLPHSLTEVNTIASLFGLNKNNIDKEVDVLKMRKMIQNRSMFHYAGHAIASEQESYLAIQGIDGITKINSNQIKHMYNNLDLVTLSACETGLGQFHVGEGMKSLASAFVESGSKSVLYSLWKVDDESTSKLMSIFYSKLKNGLDKDKALQQAKKEYLENSSPDKRHPYYWAGFVLTGSTEPIMMTDNLWVIFSVAILSLLVLPIFFIKLRTHRTRKPTFFNTIKM